MKVLTGLIFGLLSFSLMAVEVGDSAPCVYLDTVVSGVGTESVEQCVTDKSEGHQFTILEFMSITCGACIKNLPKISALAVELGDHVTTKMVSIDRNVEAVNSFLETNESLITFLFAFDNERVAKTAYSIRYTPTMFILNDEDEVIYKHIGTLTEEHIAEIKELVAVEDAQ